MAEGLTTPQPDRAPDVASSAAPAIEPAPAATTANAPRRQNESRPYRYRFGLAYLVLAVVAGVGVGATIILLDREPTVEARWSAWQPTGSEGSYPSQIADHVSGRYRDPGTGRSLVGVLASRPQIQTPEGSLPIQAVAIQSDPEGNSDDVTIVSTEERSLMYTLCGLGQSCAIEEGEPTVDRFRLLRREALELALYSFKYTDLSNVIVLLPPNIGDQDDPADDQSTALFFERSDLGQELGKPLQATLDVRERPAMDTPRGERLTLSRLTDTRTFRYAFRQTPAAFAVMILAPLL